MFDASSSWSFQNRSKNKVKARSMLPQCAQALLLSGGTGKMVPKHLNFNTKRSSLFPATMCLMSADLASAGATFDGEV